MSLWNRAKRILEKIFCPKKKEESRPLKISLTPRAKSFRLVHEGTVIGIIGWVEFPSQAESPYNSALREVRADRMLLAAEFYNLFQGPLEQVFSIYWGEDVFLERVLFTRARCPSWTAKMVLLEDIRFVTPDAPRERE